MNAFDAATALMFRDANVSVAASYRAGGVAPGVAVRVIRRAPDLTDTFGERRIVTATTLIDVRVTDVAEPVAGDTFVIGSEVLRVQGKPVRDSLRLTWTCEAAVVA